MSKYKEFFYNEEFWKDIYEARRLYRSGLRFCEISEILHKPAPKISEWVMMANNRDEKILMDAKNPDSVSIRQGIKKKFADELWNAGFKTIGEARVLCSDSLSCHRSTRVYGYSYRVTVSGEKSDDILDRRSASLDAVNAVRTLLCAEPLMMPERRVYRTKGDMQVKKAVKLLESLGYCIIGPKDVNLTTNGVHNE